MHSARVLNEQPRGHFCINFCIIADSLMECDREEESGEMYSPNELGEYMPCMVMHAELHCTGAARCSK